MPVLSIIACRILEDELAYLLSKDRELRYLILIDSPDSMGLTTKLRSENRPHMRISQEALISQLNDIMKDDPSGIWKPLLNKAPFLRSFIKQKPEDKKGQKLVVVVNVLRMALHSDVKMLQDEVYKTINYMSSFSDGILLFFGLCGSSLADTEKDFIDLKSPLNFLTTETGERVDDCIAVALGGNKQYEETLRGYPGVGIFFTPMWAFNWRDIDKEVSKSSKSQSLGMMLTNLGYKKVAKLDTGLHFISDFEIESKISEFSDVYNLEIIKLQGSTAVVERCYKQAREDVINRSAFSHKRSLPGTEPFVEGFHNVPTKTN